MFNDDKLEEIRKNIPYDWQDSPYHSTVTPFASYVPTRVPLKEVGVKLPPDFTPIGVLLSEPEEEISWVIDELLPSSGFSIIAAKPKVGKSTLARQVAHAVARGDSFFGCETTKGTVLYLALEEKRSEVKRHFRQLSDVFGDAEKDSLQVYADAVPKDPHSWLEKKIKESKPVLVIIDTLFRFVSIKNGNDYAEVTTALSPLLALARNHGAHLMVVHHAGKGGREGGDSILGSTAIFGSVDTSIILRRTESKRTIETQQRYGKDMDPTLLVFDDTTQTTSLGGTKEEDDIKTAKVGILDFFKTIEGPVGEAVIREDVEGRIGPKSKALRQLVISGEITRTGKGVSGNPFLYSRSLVPDIYTGQEKQETKEVEKADTASTIACSEDSTTSEDF